MTNNITKLSFHNVFNLFFRNLALYAKSMHVLMATIWDWNVGKGSWQSKLETNTWNNIILYNTWKWYQILFHDMTIIDYWILWSVKTTKEILNCHRLHSSKLNLFMYIIPYFFALLFNCGHYYRCRVIFLYYMPNFWYNLNKQILTPNWGKKNFDNTFHKKNGAIRKVYISSEIICFP